MDKGYKIKLLRESVGLSQVDLANVIGVSKQTLYKYENGIVTNIPSDKIEAIAKATNSTPAYIMGWQDDPSCSESVSSFSSDRAALLADYDRLNPVGKEKAREYLSDLAGNPKYTEDGESSGRKMA